MVHESAHGYQYSSASYVTGRPSYHPVVVDALVADLGTERWVEIGAGTGIATAMLAERGASVTAVEPVEAMRAALAERLAGIEDARIDVRAGTAEALPVVDNGAGVVVAAQAFHWFDHAPALDEIARVLGGHGALVTLWNVRDESVPWMAQWTEIVDRHAGDTPRHRTMLWRRAIEGDGRFSLEAEIVEPNPWPSTPDELVARVRSTSFIGRLDDATRTDVETAMRSLVGPFGDRFDVPYRTEAQVWRLAG